jgi:hypothetical protein
MLLPLVLFAQHKSPEEIAQELAEAEKQFNDALEIFDPWYTGPLITPGASMMPVGEANTQPYLFFTDTYAAFNEDRKSVGLAHNLLQLKGTVNIQTGITPNLDLNFNFATGTVNWQDGQTGGGYGDTSAVAGFLIYKQTRYVPQMKFTITQTFPTGKYKNLHSDGLNGTGAGAYSTQFGLIIAKVLFWNTPHPMNMRLFLGYQLSTPVTVKGYNAYGGGVGTHGRVHPGNAFSVDFGYEYSINQKWVVATDVVYSTTNRTKFHGTPGTTSGGTPASVGSGYSDNLSLSPAIEYNFNENLGIIAGAWFSVYGRNSGNFASGIFSVTYTFP